MKCCMLPSLLDHFSRSKKGKDQKTKTSKNFLREKKVLINIFNTTLFKIYTYFKTPSKSPVIHFKRQIISVLFLEAPAVSSSGLSEGHGTRASCRQDKNPGGRNPVVAGSCFHLTQRGSAPSGHKVPHCPPARHGAGLRRPGCR